MLINGVGKIVMVVGLLSCWLTEGKGGISVHILRVSVFILRFISQGRSPTESGSHFRSSKLFFKVD